MQVVVAPGMAKNRKLAGKGAMQAGSSLWDLIGALSLSSLAYECMQH